MNRRRIASLMLVVSLLAAACGSGVSEEPADTMAPTATEPVGDPAPLTRFQLFDGPTASLADFAGQPVVLNFWASWCPSCVAEMSNAFRPVEQELGSEITFLGMNLQDDPALAKSLLDETGVQWINAADPAGDLYVELGGIAMPFTVYLNADGRIVETHNGPLTLDQLREQIAEIFG